MEYHKKQTILILEDDEDLAEGISMSLNSKDLEFVLCRTISEARSKLRQGSFDLLIFDINLPDGSGLELCRRNPQVRQSPDCAADSEGHGNGYREGAGEWRG